MRSWGWGGGWGALSEAVSSAAAVSSVAAGLVNVVGAVGTGAQVLLPTGNGLGFRLSLLCV
jgi:hypothetical protein